MLVDNCYGELVEEREPDARWRGSRLGIADQESRRFARAGRRLCGRPGRSRGAVSARLYAPGLHSGLGPTLGFGRAFVQGLFIAPAIVEQTLRGLDFAAALFAELGFEVDPQPGAVRTDIVQAIRLLDAQRLLRFTAGLQTAMPLNARFRPEPGSVPGYVDPVVMSSGAFVGGATIELSCDAPLRAPFEVYLQGGIVAEHAMLGALLAAASGDGLKAAPQQQRRTVSGEYSRGSLARAPVLPGRRGLPGHDYRPGARVGFKRSRGRSQSRRHADYDDDRPSRRTADRVAVYDPGCGS